MLNPELRRFCQKNGFLAKIQKEFGNTKRSSCLEWLHRTYGGDTRTEPVTVEPETMAELETVAETDPAADLAEAPADYSGLDARQLYVLCLQRRIETAPRQSAEVYRALLESADAPAAPAELAAPAADDEDLEDWDEADTPAEAPAPAADDEDDDWDI